MEGITGELMMILDIARQIRACRQYRHRLVASGVDLHEFKVQVSSNCKDPCDEGRGRVAITEIRPLHLYFPS